MDIILVPILRLFMGLLNFYILGLFVYVIMSLLDQFGVINRYNKIVFMVTNFLFRLYEPVLGRIRGILPKLGGIDFSPMIYLILLYFIQDIIIRILIRFPA
jgi:YggT family protein